MFKSCVRVTSSTTLLRFAGASRPRCRLLATTGNLRFASATAEDEYDYVIVGAGSAGCVVAHRLVTGDSSLRVLLTEAGPARDQYWKVRMPGGTLMILNNPELDWCFQTEPQVHLDGRRLCWPRGKLLGGSSSVNAMVYIRGHAADFNRWAAAEGASGWSYAECLPYFKKAQNHELECSEYRGNSGPLYVSPGKSKNPLHDAFVAAGLQAGYAHTDDFNGPQQEGFGRYDFTIKTGQRASTAAMYLRPAMKMADKRLTVLPDTLVSRVLFDGRRAVGIECQTGGTGSSAGRRIRASREVILCGGTVNSPHLLLLSGVGPADHLRQVGVPLLHHLPGVGANLQDHVNVPIHHQCTKPLSFCRNQWKHPINMSRTLLKWWLLSSGDMISTGGESGAFVRSRSDVEHADVQISFSPGGWISHGASAFTFDTFQAAAWTLRAKSRGRVTLKSANPSQPPAIQPNYMAAEEDLIDLRNAVRIVRKVISQRAFDEFRGEELLPGKQLQTDSEIDSFVRQRAETTYHPTSSCAMGSPDKNEMAVVDTACRVVGLERLRVVDASVMPSIVSGNTNAATIMIAEKVSDMILGKRPLERAAVTD